MAKEYKIKETQGRKKMLLYLEELVRNKNFIKLLKKVKKQQKKNRMPEGMYVDWTPEQQKEHDYFNDEYCSIVDGYEMLRKRCKKLLRDKNHIARQQIASGYGLDNDLINFAVAMHSKSEESIKFYKNYLQGFDDIDMCKVLNIYEETMSPFNKGEEIIYLRNDLQVLFNACPIAIAINSNASKRDVLDFIEKRWEWIDSILRQFDKQKGLKIRERKYNQEMIDFIWENRGLTSKQIKTKLDEKFTTNNLVYFEIAKIIQLEKKRREKIWFE